MAAKLERAKALGAYHVINTSRVPDWAAQVLDVTGGQGADHVLELLGGDNMRQSVEALADGGRIAQIGFLSGPNMTLPAVPLMLRRAVIQGITVGHRHAFEDMVEAIDRYRIKPVIDRIHSFDATRAALVHLERGPFGKVVISMNAARGWIEDPSRRGRFS